LGGFRRAILYFAVKKGFKNMEYNPRKIEQKWNEYWEKNDTYKVENGGDKPKFYVLDMFPYPSGAGLHVGHPLGYIASDIFARYKRLKGFNVLHPMGFDSFGLPAEQYAIQTGQHPAVTTEANIATYIKQLKKIGFSYDWSREVRTSEPNYYKWTQWIFMQLFNHYYDKSADKALPISALINIFATDGNAGVKAVCDEETPLFSATEWNAMSEAQQQMTLLHYRLTFPNESMVNFCPALGMVLSNDEIKDGVSERGGYPVVQKKMKQWSMRITAYCDRLIDGLNEVDWSESLKEQQRNWIGRSVGASVKFSSLNPSNVGAKKKVEEQNSNLKPSENHKVFPFGEDLDGAVIEVFTTRVDTIYGVSFMVLAPEHELVASLTTPEQKEEVEKYQAWAASRSEIDRMSEVKRVSGAFTGSYVINPFNGERVPIYIADYVLAGYGTGAVMGVPSGDQRDWNFAKHFNLPIIPILDAQKGIEEQADNTKEGKYINSGMINGMGYKEATATLIAWLEERGLGKGKTQFRLRNAIFSRQRYWGEPVPAYFKGDVPYLIDESELPLILPEVDKYLPTETGEPPLGRAKDWKYELSTMPGWAGSSWYWYRYMDAKNDNEFASKEAIDYWKAVDVYVGGTEHATGHLLYSRFWNHFLYDLGIVPEREFAKKLVNQGMIQGRSNLVYRAKEHFYEEFLWQKVLQPFFPNAKKMSLTPLEEAVNYDFYLENTDLAIEVVSYKNEAKIARKKGMAMSDGKRLLVLTNEELIENINEPDKIVEKIKEAINSQEAFIQNEKKPIFEQLFVSYDLTKKYASDVFSKLHVDVNIVENDVLDIEKTKNILQFEKSNFKLNTSGQFTCSWEVEKMSKSKFNVVNPDSMVEKYGADCFRMYEMFLGPIEQAKPWDTNGISGVSGFLRKLWSLCYDSPSPTLPKGKGDKCLINDEVPTADELKALHTCIKDVTGDIERFSLNTCVSNFMKCVNELKKLNCSKRLILNDLAILLAPFAPYTAEEIWAVLGNEPSVHHQSYPVYNEGYLVSDTVEYPIAINGKTRDIVAFPTDADQAFIEEAIKSNEKVQKHLDGQTIKKVIFVKGRMVNIVV
jgi:leucyl-tRNA synthetase